MSMAFQVTRCVRKEGGKGKKEDVTADKKRSQLITVPKTSLTLTRASASMCHNERSPAYLFSYRNNRLYERVPSRYRLRPCACSRRISTSGMCACFLREALTKDKVHLPLAPLAPETLSFRVRNAITCARSGQLRRSHDGRHTAVSRWIESLRQPHPEEKASTS